MSKLKDIAYECSVPINDYYAMNYADEVIEKVPSMGILVKEGRMKHNLTQAALAQLTGLTTAEISRIEGGITKKPAKKVLQSLSPYIGISYTRLLLYAGYSGVIEKPIYYNKIGEPIPYQTIVDNIYNADSELLELLKEINRISLDDIEIIKNLLVLMKTISTIDSPKNSSNILEDMFDAIKEFLTSQLSILIKLLKSPLSHV